MRLTITINLDNAAFERHSGPESARILRQLADKLEGDPELTRGSIALSDINGNRVGEAAVEEEYKCKA